MTWKYLASFTAAWCFGWSVINLSLGESNAASWALATAISVTAYRVLLGDVRLN